ncbi:hypothetical protein QUF80_04880 [Desulfococcaceae bacterium HSG8]|nr:hypothetical protein [Desulfococcaceae bacterium HSG8]
MHSEEFIPLQFITHHVSRITFHVSRFTFHVSPSEPPDHAPRSLL